MSYPKGYLSESDYSLKTRSAPQFKNVPFHWVDRCAHKHLFYAQAKVPLMLLYFFPDDSAMNGELYYQSTFNYPPNDLRALVTQYQQRQTGFPTGLFREAPLS
ncbi:hypothetical protein HCU74_04785 [Spongiibacter sp. KMU-166]|uniref:Uncharacterized protein n=1 Tax=Spongiibacter thalassae TaxID=2721624 RepID=A0ABX1GC65_9GAMM|nr:hypothetical protein [Spongiibacter thalassae]NKI16735.1 hypothetical protein [Spongiibacter thalassae]